MAGRWMNGLVGAAALVATGGPALATTPARTVVLIDPSDAESMYVGNHYVTARGIPEANVLYIDPAAPDYATFVAENLVALAGALAQRGTTSQIDTIVIAPTDAFRISAPNLLGAAGCPAAVGNFSLTGAYTTAFIAGEVLAGDVVTRSNGYHSPDPDGADAFDAGALWAGGAQSAGGDRYYLSAMLGYTPGSGNTVGEIIDLIDRSVASDGTGPNGRFYFQTTNDAARSGPRDFLYDSIVSAIVADGGDAENRMGQLPNGRQDILGIMTGDDVLPIPGANLGILPGAFCEHLTSFGGVLSGTGQTEISAWIREGASATFGTVEEPCNFPGKFPHPAVHAQYFDGLTLGEAAFRSLAFVPFQGLLYGDPLTRPFATIPSLIANGVPTGPSDALFLSVQLDGTPAPGRSMGRFDAYIDGVFERGRSGPGTLLLFTVGLSDGWHELRFEGADDSDAEVRGEMVTSLVVDFAGERVDASGVVTSGDLSDEIVIDAEARVGSVVGVRLVHNGRVIATAPTCDATFRVPGSTIGAGASRVRVEALKADGSTVSSAPIDVDVAFSGANASTDPPRSVAYTVTASENDPVLLTLPAMSDDDPSDLVFSIVSGPAQGTLLGGGTSGFRTLVPGAGAAGADRIVYRVTSPDGTSADATIVVQYDAFPIDRDGDGVVGVEDVYAIEATPSDADLDGDADAHDAAFVRMSARCAELLDALAVRE